MQGRQEFFLGPFTGGYDSLDPPDAMDNTLMARGSVNLSTRERGAVTKRKGYAKTKSDFSADTYTESLGVHEFFDGTRGKRSLVHVKRNTSSNDIKYETNGAYNLPTASANFTTSASIGSATTTEQYVSFADGLLDRLYIGAKWLSVVKYISWDGAVFSITNTTTTGSVRSFTSPVGLATYFGRVWCFLDSGTEGGEYLFWSNLAGTQFDRDLSWIQFPDGGPITGLARIGNDLLVFKQSEIYVLSGGENVDRALTTRKLQISVGCVAPRSIVTHNGWVYFMSDNGFYKTNGSDISLISRSIQNEFDQFSRTDLSRVCGAHNREDNTIVWLVAFGESATENNRAYCYDYDKNIWCSPYTNQAFTSICTYHNDYTGKIAKEIMIASGETKSGATYIWNYGLSDDGTLTNAKLVTKAIHFGTPSRRKLVRRVYVHWGSRGPTLGSGTTGTRWGVDPWGTSAFPGGSPTPLKLRVFSSYGNADSDTAPTGEVTSSSSGSEYTPYYKLDRFYSGSSGHYHQLQFEDYNFGSILGGPWSVHGFTILFVTKGQRP